MSIPKSEWKWFGISGHFICADYCRFHLYTQVGDYLVSTIGEYVPDSSVRKIFAESRGIRLAGNGDEREADWLDKNGFEKVGWNRKYETMVFYAGDPCTAADCNCGIPAPEDYVELAMQGYNTRGDAQRGHYQMCDDFSQKGKP